MNENARVQKAGSGRANPEYGEGERIAEALLGGNRKKEKTTTGELVDTGEIRGDLQTERSKEKIFCEGSDKKEPEVASTEWQEKPAKAKKKIRQIIGEPDRVGKRASENPSPREGEPVKAAETTHDPCSVVWAEDVEKCQNTNRPDLPKGASKGKRREDV